MRSGLTIALVLAAIVSNGQKTAINLEQFAERLFQVQEENINYEDVYESLLLFYTNKLNLNDATPEELQSLYLLNPLQIQAFFSYRNTYGILLSVNELQVIPAFELNTIRAMLPFVTVAAADTHQENLLKRVLKEENNYFLFRYSRRLEKQLGYSSAFPRDTTFVRNQEGAIIDTATNAPSRYRGSPDKVYGRFRSSRRGDFSVGFTFEKDAGEVVSFKENRSGFDFYSAHLLLENKAGFRKIILGDFQLQTGQGLVFGAGFNPGKGAETVNSVKRTTAGIRPYTSALEHGFFRGVGLSKKIGNLEITGFYSSVQRDGNIKLDSRELSSILKVDGVQMDPNQLFEEEFVNSIVATGLHRTATEIERRRSISESSIGGAMVYSQNRTFNIGVNTLLTRFSIPIRKTPNNYNQFEFKGDQNFIGSIFSSLIWQNFSFFGELSRSSSGGLGGVGGLVSSLSKTIDLAVLIRNYERDFHTFHGNAFAEGSRNINEKGIYWGLAIRPTNKHQFNLYYDRFRFPWLRFRADAPTNGSEWLIRYSYLPAKKVKLFAQLRSQTRQITEPFENLNMLVDQVRHNYLLNVDYELNEQFRLRTRIQGSAQQQGGRKTRGFALIQDVNFSFWKLIFHTRAALFETDDFSNAQYVYESDVLYSFAIPAYNGTGIRNYVMVRYDPIRSLSFWLRYARTSFPSSLPREQVHGQGLEASTGATVSEVKLMLRVRF